MMSINRNHGQFARLSTRLPAVTVFAKTIPAQGRGLWL
jgi:hypothetical protein